MHPNGGAAIDGVKLILWAGCDEERLAFNFVAQGKKFNEKQHQIKRGFSSKTIVVSLAIGKSFIMVSIILGTNTPLKNGHVNGWPY